MTLLYCGNSERYIVKPEECGVKSPHVLKQKMRVICQDPDYIIRNHGDSHFIYGKVPLRSYSKSGMLFETRRNGIENFIR